MEFTRLAAVDMAAADIQRHVNVANLPEWCASIVEVHSKDSNQGRITCLSGDFVVHRELLNSGVRFSIPAGPHAIQWTITTDSPGEVLVHCTVNSPQATTESDLSQALNCFVDNWQKGLESWEERREVRPAPACGVSDFTMGGFG
jgi:hypothetical protein